MASPLPPKRRYAGIRSGYRFRDPYISNRLSGESGEITTVQEQAFGDQQGLINRRLRSPYGEGFSSEQPDTAGRIFTPRDKDVELLEREEMDQGRQAEDIQPLGVSPSLAPLPEAESPNVATPVAPATSGQAEESPEASNEIDFIGLGGSQRQWNRALSKAGVRPKIDARAKPDPQAARASAEIRAQWGWDKDSMSLPY